MAATIIKMDIMDENASEKCNQVQVKKLTVPPNEATKKRAALGELQNRGLVRDVAAKDVAQKELNNVKARVDTHWKKQPLGTAQAAVNGAAAKAAAPLLRSNSMRTVAVAATAAAAPSSKLTRQVTVPTRLANAKLAAEVNSKRKFKSAVAQSACPPNATSLPSQRAVAAAAAKPKPTTDELPATTLRREDSNLARKSLTKLRAAIAKASVPVAQIKKDPHVAPTVGVAPQKEVVDIQSKLAKATTTLAKTTVALPSQRLAIEAQFKKEAHVAQAKKEPLAQLKPVVRKEAPTVAAAPKKEVVKTTVALPSQRLAIEDIDADDRDNLILVSEYVNDIYDYLYEVEEQKPIHPDHLGCQLEVTHKMRAVLIDWINEVHLQFHLTAETFHLAVAIIDLYLQFVNNTKRKYLQLVGVTALFIATKYEELYPPAIADFVFITDDTYTGREIRKMELQMLKAIDHNLSRPLPIHFLRRYSKAAGAEDEHHTMSKYFLELASMDYNLTSYKPSEIAAASLFLSLHLLNGNARAATGFNDKHWTPTLAHYSRYTAAELRPIARQIAKQARDAPTAKLKAVFNKYQAAKFQKIALRSELSGPLLNSIVGKK